MKKKRYQNPSLKIYKMDVATIICTSANEVINTDGNGGFDYGGGGSGPAHARQNNFWDEDDDQSVSSGSATDKSRSLSDIITRERNGHHEWL